MADRSFFHFGLFYSALDACFGPLLINDDLVKSRKYGWQSKKFKPSLNRGRANLEECKKCSGGLQAATMMWKAKAFRYNNRETPKDAAQQRNWAFYEAIN